MNALSQFHFIRPEWLWVFPLAALIWWRMRRQRDALRGWRKTIAPQLLPYLLVNSEQADQALKPVGLLGMLWLLGIVALAGPSWQREASPFAEEQAVLVVIIKLTPSMQASDIQPNRLVRAVDKIDRLLAQRPDTRTALIAYAGSAHRVIPFTRDHALIVDFARELSPAVMPRVGEELLEAVQLGEKLIQDNAHPGTILVLADSVDPGQILSLKENQANRSAVELWAIAASEEVIPLPGSPPAPALDEANMQAAADAFGGSLEIISVDHSDVEAINRRIGRHLADISQAEGERWRDAGYYFLPLMVFLGLFWFRKGWVIRWAD
jgi:Ca-activated chloride channel family protein